MIRLERLETPELERILKQLRDKSVPFATKQMVNKTAFDARGYAQEEIEDEMTLRNKWTRGSVRVVQTKTLNIREQRASVGSTQEYMRHQEEGYTSVSRGKHGHAIPTGYSAGQEGQRPRTKLPRRPNQVQNIRLARFRARGKTTKQRALRAVQEGIKSGHRLVYINFGPGKKKGIMRILGGRKTFKRGWPDGARLKMIHALQKTVRIHKRPWLVPAVIRARRNMPGHYRDALIFQIKRLQRR